MMKRFCKALSILLIFMFTVTLFAGCGSTENKTPDAKTPETKQGEKAEAKKITVIIPKHEMDTKGFFEQKTREFEKASGIQVEFISMSWDNVADKITAEMATNGTSFDVMEFDNAWVAKFVTNGWVAPLDEFLTEDMKNGILPGLLEKFSYKGQHYGIPWNNDTRFFMYNKKKLADAGISAPPKTWTELAEQSKILKSKGLVKYGFIDSLMQAQSGTNELTYFVYTFGGDFLDKDSKPAASGDKGVKAAYEFLSKGLQEDKIIDPASVSSDYQTVANVFLKGDTAFFVQAWPGVYTMADDPSVSKIKGEIAVAPYALGADESSAKVLTLPEAYAIPQSSKNKKEAWEYIKFMSSKDFDKQKGQEIGALPIWKDNFNDADLLKMYPYWESFGKQSQNAKGLQDILWYDEMSNIVQVESLKILMNKASVDEGLKTMDEQFKKKMR